MARGTLPVAFELMFGDEGGYSFSGVRRTPGEARSQEAGARPLTAPSLRDGRTAARR